MDCRPYISFDTYFDSLRGQNVSVLGYGISNRPLALILARHGAHVTVHDRQSFEELGEDALELQRLGVGFCLGDGYKEGLGGADVIFRSPGIRPDLPEIKSCGAYLASEMEAFFEVCPCRIIAVTGSDGKSTTTTLISKMLASAGFRVWLGGNIGNPLVARVPEMRPDDVAVVELSSFQLMTMHRSPDTAVVTNIAPNHLDIHRDMQEYIDAKRNILLNLPSDGRAVLNAGNAAGASLYESIPAGAELAWFNSDGAKGELSVFRDENSIYICRGGRTDKALDIGDILLPGRHNVENYMAAIAATEGLCSVEHIYEVATTFGGVEHRLQLVRTRGGVKYYNSSIDSSPTRTNAALSVFGTPIVAIMGGYDKHIPFEPLAPVVKEHCAAVVISGDTADKLRAVLEPTGVPLIDAADMADAVAKAAAEAESRGCAAVVLTPACASFDRYKNFEERGKDFCRRVNEL